MSTFALVSLALQPAIAVVVTFGMFGNGWPTFVVSLSLQVAWVLFSWRRGWL